MKAYVMDFLSDKQWVTESECNLAYQMERTSGNELVHSTEKLKASKLERKKAAQRETSLAEMLVRP